MVTQSMDQPTSLSLNLPINNNNPSHLIFNQNPLLSFNLSINNNLPGQLIYWSTTLPLHQSTTTTPLVTQCCACLCISVILFSGAGDVKAGRGVVVALGKRTAELPLDSRVYAAEDLPIRVSCLRGTVAPDFVGPFLACLDRPGWGKEPLLVLKFFSCSFDFWRPF